MAYDATLLAAVDAALLELVQGARVVSVSVNGKTVQFSQTGIGELRLFRSTVADAVAAAAVVAADTPGYIRTRTSKGL